MKNEQIPLRQIRAYTTESTIRVYQAYSPAIAVPAVAAQQFVPPFKRDRMTWIKPSFLWMMYRCGWGMKPGQEHVLAIDIHKSGFEWALRHSAWAHFDPHLHDSEEAWRTDMVAQPVRVQWDPERSETLEKLSHRSIQIGLSGEAVEKYVDEWTVTITDISDTVRAIREGDEAALHQILSVERPITLPTDIVTRIGATG